MSTPHESPSPHQRFDALLSDLDAGSLHFLSRHDPHHQRDYYASRLEDDALVPRTQPELTLETQTETALPVQPDASNTWSTPVLYERNQKFKLNALTLTPEDQTRATHELTPEDNSLDRVKPISAAWAAAFRGRAEYSPVSQPSEISSNHVVATGHGYEPDVADPEKQRIAAIKAAAELKVQIEKYKRMVVFGEPFEADGVPIDMDETLAQTTILGAKEHKRLADLVSLARRRSQSETAWDLLNQYKSEAIAAVKDRPAGTYSRATLYQPSEQILYKLAESEGWSPRQLDKQLKSLHLEITPRKWSTRGVARRIGRAVANEFESSTVDRSIKRHNRSVPTYVAQTSSTEAAYQANFTAADTVVIPRIEQKNFEHDDDGPTPIMVLKDMLESRGDMVPIKTDSADVVAPVALVTPPPADYQAATVNTSRQIVPERKQSTPEPKVERRFGRWGRRVAGTVALAGVVSGALFAAGSGSLDTDGSARPDGNPAPGVSALPTPGPSFDRPIPTTGPTSHASEVPTAPKDSLPATGGGLNPNTPSATDIPLETMQDGSVWATVRNDLGRDPTSAEMEQVFALNKASVGPAHLDLNWDTAKQLSDGYQFHNPYDGKHRAP